jgi:large subunit ribosomal protein L10
VAKRDKEERIEELAEMLKRAKGLVLSDFTGLNVSEMTELRRRCRENRVQYLVVKNSLARFAASKAEMDELVPYLRGPNGLTFGFEDPLVPARVIHSFAQESEKLAIKAGVFGGGMMGPDDVKRIALLPGRDVLLSQVLMQMNAPIAGFAGALRSMLAKLVYVLAQVKDVKLGVGGGTAAPPAEAEGGDPVTKESVESKDEKVAESKKEE